MNIKKIKIEDFVALPRKIKHDYIAGNLTRNGFDILLWIWINTNPYNGYFTADYKALEREFRSRISYDNIRKIISNLRKTQHIYFLNHKGRKGSFPIYPIGFLLTNGNIQDTEYIRNRLSITTKNLIEAKLKDNEGEGYHKSNPEKHYIYKGNTKRSELTITTPYNNNDNNNNNNNKEYYSSLSSKGKPYFRGDEMRWKNGKWWVLPTNGGSWLEFAGSKEDIEWK